MSRIETACAVSAPEKFGRWRGGARKELGAEVDRIAAFLERSLRIEIVRVAR